MRREIPTSEAREYGERRSPTIFGEFSDPLRHPGHRIVLLRFLLLSIRFVVLSRSAPWRSSATRVAVPLPATPFMAGGGAAVSYQDHTACLAPAGSTVWAMAQMKPTSSRATAVIASADFLPRAIRRR